MYLCTRAVENIESMVLTEKSPGRVWYYLEKHCFVKLGFISLAGALVKNGATLRPLGSLSLDFLGGNNIITFHRKQTVDMLGIDTKRF